MIFPWFRHGSPDAVGLRGALRDYAQLAALAALTTFQPSASQGGVNSYHSF
jgi:hypothetical protein